MDSELIEKFFNKLSERRSGENDLSDITWALMDNVPSLTCDFLEFFGFQVSNNSRINIEREFIFPRTNFRIDYAFFFQNNLLLLENKIWDMNCHIEDYTKASQNIKDVDNIYLGIITNYYLQSSDKELAEKFKWKIRNWKDFYELIINKDYGDYQLLINGYKEYVKKVCSMIEINEIRFEKQSLNSLFHLMNLIIKLIDSSSHDDYNYKLYSTKREFSDNALGHYYVITNLKTNKSAYPWFGISIDKEPEIYIWIDEDWNFFFNELRNLSGYNYDKYNKAIYISLSKSNFDNFNKSNKDEQEMILREFINNANKQIEQYLS